MSAAHVPTTAIENDVPCLRCGYNLRTLAPTGKCPECGAEVAPSLRAYLAKRPELPPPDAKWSREVVEGAWLSLTGFGFFVALLLAPSEWFHLRWRDTPVLETPSRIVVLAVACTAWVLAWYSVWKITMPAPPGDRHAPRRLARAARWGVTIYFCLPLLVAIYPSYHKSPPPGPLILIPIFSPVACLLVLLYVARLFDRIGRRGAAVVATVFAIAYGGFMFCLATAVMSRREYETGSLQLLLKVPIYPYGTAEIGREAVRDLARGGSVDEMTFFSVLGASAVLLIAWLLVCYRPLARGAVAPSAP